MILAFVMQTATPVPPVPVPVPAPSDDVVVIGERLKNWSGTITSNPLVTRCKTTRSTGDAAIDAIGCEAMRACWPDARRGYRQVEDRHLAPADRQRIKVETDAAFGGCIRTQRTTLIAALVAKGGVREGAYK